MINNELLNYIKNQILSGATRDEIKDALFSVGWKNVDIEEAFSKMNIINTNIVNDTIINKEDTNLKVEDKSDKPAIESAIIDINKLNNSNNINSSLNNNSSNSKNKYKRSSIIIMLTLLLILLGFAYFIYQKSILKKSENINNTPIINNPNLDQGQYIENMYNKNTSTTTSSTTEAVDSNH